MRRKLVVFLRRASEDETVAGRSWWGAGQATSHTYDPSTLTTSQKDSQTI